MGQFENDQILNIPAHRSCLQGKILEFVYTLISLEIAITILNGNPLW